MDKDVRDELTIFKDSVMNHINKLSSSTKSMNIRINDILKENILIKKQNKFLNDELKKIKAENQKLAGIYSQLRTSNINTEHSIHQIKQNLDQVNSKLHTKS